MSNNLLSGALNLDILGSLNTMSGVPAMETPNIGLAPVTGPNLTLGQSLKKGFNNIFTDNIDPSGWNLNAANAIGGISGFAGSLVPKTGSAITDGINEGVDGALNAVSALGPAGMVVGGIGKAANAFGKGLSSLTGADDMQQTRFDQIAGSGLGFLAGGWINRIGAQMADTIDVDEDVQMSSGYTGTADNVLDADAREGRYGWMSGGRRRDANREIAEANLQQTLAKGVLDTNQLAREAATNYQSGFANKYMQTPMLQYGQDGAKLMPLDVLKSIRNSKILKQAKGGKMKNVIAGGALHARKHNITAEDMKGMTHKGIPVVAADGGKLIQTAEIEDAELILNKELTKTLEELYKDGSDEAMLKAGKILAKEIIRNTIDKSKEGILDD